MATETSAPADFCQNALYQALDFSVGGNYLICACAESLCAMVVNKR